MEMLQREGEERPPARRLEEEAGQAANGSPGKSAPPMGCAAQTAGVGAPMKMSHPWDWITLRQLTPAQGGRWWQTPDNQLRERICGFA